MARLTGLSIDTLRAWERRHAAVTPVRDDRGRMYSEADVQRLQLLRDLVALGHPIGRIAGQETPALEELIASARATTPERDRPAEHAGTTASQADILEALERFDTAAVEAALGRAAAMLSPVELLRDVIVPVMQDLGDAWCARRVSVAHEHLLSATIRNVLGSFLRLYGHPRSPVRVLVATPSHERHELGTLGAAMMAAAGGLDVLYLGPDLPAGDLVDCAVAAEADVVIVGVTGAVSADAIQDQVHAIARRLPPDIELWVGGAAAGPMTQGLGSRVLVVPDYAMLSTHLRRIGASV